jgi:hypothetical protein
MKDRWVPHIKIIDFSMCPVRDDDILLYLPIDHKHLTRHSELGKTKKNKGFCEESTLL